MSNLERRVKSVVYWDGGLWWGILNYIHAHLKKQDIYDLFFSLLSFANVARERNYVRPKFNDENRYEIANGRHPLWELGTENYIPNDYYSGGPHTRVKILTGPNGSGKTAYLKQTAVLVYLAHIGSYLPAKSANIGITDSIYARVHTTESASAGLSSFMLDITQVSLKKSL